MRQQIIDGLTAAKMDNVFRASAVTIEGIADYVLDALGKSGEVLDARVKVLDKAETVLEIEASDFVAAIARAATMPSFERNATITSKVIQMGSEFHLSERHLAWTLMPMFGVHLYENHGNMQIAGRDTAITTFTSILNALLTAGRGAVAWATDDERKTFWQTVGALIVDTPAAKRQIADAKGMHSEAKDHCQYVWGTANVVQRPKVAENGEPLFQKAASTIAEVMAG